MRLIPFITGLLLTIALIFVLDNKWGAIPPLGRFLSPQQGFWQNAEPAEGAFNESLSFPGLKEAVNVYLDERLVPHVFARNEADAYFVQGYLHAKFRLWQMEFQTMAAAGRISEVLGNDPRFIRFDREQRRLGMVFAAENALKEMEADPDTKGAYDAYTAGVNAYINTLSDGSLPVEYKLLDYRPERWSNLKIALFLKQMSKDLAGFDRDLSYTNANSAFSVEELRELFPEVSDSSRPIIPAGTPFSPPGILPVPPPTADSLYFNKDTAIRSYEVNMPARNNGSNNWALSGSRTQSGAPLLANDPHLGLSLPSIWFEMQISTPTMNVYGATFPGSPSVIIGFNEQIAFGFTNAQRDIKDYYQVRFRDASKREYWFNGKWEPARLKVEQIAVRGGGTVLDTVAYTVFGPVMYDESFTIDSANNTALALRWGAHDPSNEGLMWLKLNRARNYAEYEEAIKVFSVPGQNMLFASKTGDIALWQQARFPARWEGQGMFVMPGEDSSYMWQGFIPQAENPHVINPASGYIQSANQRPVDSTYPYFIPGNYISARGITLARRLDSLAGATPQDMMALQNDYFSNTAAHMVPFLLKHLDSAARFNETEDRYLSLLRAWNYEARPEAVATTIYQAWLDSFERVVWEDDFARVPLVRDRPDEQTLMEALLRDTAFRYVDNIETEEVETVQQQVTAAFRKAAEALSEEEKDNELLWWKHKNPSILHLLRTAVLPFGRSGLQVGGWGNTLNAITTTHGPSWRMVVHLTTPTEAWGIYPGGQSGNPGSRFYDDYIDSWVAGKYHVLWMMKETEARDPRVKWKMTFTKA